MNSPLLDYAAAALGQRATRLGFGVARALPARLRQMLKPTLRRLWYRHGCRRLSELATCGSGVARSGYRYRVVYFPVIDWELRTQRPQQMLARIASLGCPVLYLRNDFARGPHAEISTLLPPGVRGARLPGPANLTIYGAPPSPSLVNAWLDALEPVVRPAEDPPTVALVQWPFWTDVAFGARDRWGWPVIYDCIDDHSAFTKTRREIVALEGSLVRSSAVVITASRALEAKLSGQARRHVYLPNGADWAHFASPAPRLHPANPDNPVFGYIGSLDDWFDAEIISAAARSHPGWRFELIGLNSGADLRPLARLRNVRLSGEIPYDEVAAALQRFDVAVVPFKVNQLTRACNPIKVFEYLAAGKPVVSVSLPELESFDGTVYLAADREAFVRLLGVALAENNSERVQARMSLARSNDWNNRVAVLDAEIRRALFDHR